MQITTNMGCPNSVGTFTPTTQKTSLKKEQKHSKSQSTGTLVEGQCPLDITKKGLYEIFTI